MILLRIRKRVFELSKMIGQSNQIVPFSSVFNEKCVVMQYPSFSSVKFRTFCSSRVTHLAKVSLTESTQSPGSLISNQVSRLARTEAQDVLFDYLHGTRSLSYTDAEHISKNSPYFIQSLLSKIDAEKDVTRSLARFLRYNPINEFEPFFESLGLSPLEISLLLPQHLMYLSDDDILLENYHVLWVYGIPRNKMGKMYKEAREIFGYDYGILSSKLQAYENLGLSRNTVIKLVSCCPSLLIGDVDDQFIKVLEKLKGLGFKNDWIGGYLSGKSTYNWNRTVDTMEFLEKVGYREEQLCDLFKTNPGLVFEGSGRKVYLLVGQLLKLGLKMNEIYCLFMQKPQLLSGKCTKNLLQAVGFLVEIGMRMENIANIVSKHAELMGSCSLKGPKTVCSSLKVNRDGLCQIIKDDPLKLFHLASKTKIKIYEQAELQNPSKHLEKTTFLLRLGYVENSEEMTKALKKFRGRGDQLQERFDCLVEAGLDTNIVRRIIKHAPMVLNQSKEVIEKKMDFLKNCLGFPIDSVVAFPSYLCYDLERINHRFTMYVSLRERGAAKPKLSLSTILACSDAKFVKYFVDVHPEGPAIWESIRKSSNSS
ncbi:transcription termination factor MTEF18, mitochondrial-like [Pistacia vera]|uniref:transcription termination factor MTEF18, mitochondrial-like n=1 Tax=Pistacia vera TaxID=55513 RepID=UPI0012639131|nr:transcription termination factor MTEF18, mitochondrial-like [Pistacia vera]XP_031280771.1 transcription termination factor MTEF18, mitochondrial-like [Pistacia vera]XP_031280772.1 transcription termination factor MTEF18, mitochondrial-like [Pistacia vera]